MLEATGRNRMENTSGKKIAPQRKTRDTRD